MPRLFAISAVLLGLSLGSCVSRPVAPGFGWSFHHEAGEGLKLAYGAPASDNVVLMMTCHPGSERVNVSLMGGSPQRGLTLDSGGAREHLDGVAVATPGMGQLLEAYSHPASGPLARFARTGDLNLIDRGRKVALNAAPNERPGVARFFESCRA
ncbi:MAG: hypothetical protein Q8L66_00770 [Caulobacter sp.]|nr:hypothetical protein [Caulobacter sp.]